MLSSYYHHQDLHHRHCHYHGEDFCHCLICLMIMMNMISDHLQIPRRSLGHPLQHDSSKRPNIRTQCWSFLTNQYLDIVILVWWFGGIDYSFIIIIKHLSRALDAVGDELSTKSLCSLCSIMLINYLLFQTKAIHKW